MTHSALDDISSAGDGPIRQVLWRELHSFAACGCFYTTADMQPIGCRFAFSGGDMIRSQIKIPTSGKTGHKWGTRV